MVSVKSFKQIPNKVYEYYDYPVEGKNSDMVIVSNKEIDQYHEAASICYSMMEEAASYVIKNKLYSKLGIPKFMEKVIEYTFKNRAVHVHPIARFDFAGGMDGLPIKMIECNADTPFSIFETALAQAYIAKDNKYPDEAQYNWIFEGVKNTMEYSKEHSKDKNSIIFSSYEDPEDILNTKILGEACEEAGFSTDWINWENLWVNKNIGVFTSDDGEHIGKTAKRLFKMIPWEIIIEESEHMAQGLAEAILEGNLIVHNPPYVMLFQSKGLMTIMSELFPNSPYLLKTCFNDNNLHGMTKFVTKPIWGREGNNISFVYDSELMNSTEGPYDIFPMIIQEIAEFAQDKDGRRYQAGVFVSDGEGVGLGFRRTNTNEKYEVITTAHEVCGHLIEN